MVPLNKIYHVIISLVEDSAKSFYVYTRATKCSTQIFVDIQQSSSM